MDVEIQDSILAMSPSECLAMARHLGLGSKDQAEQDRSEAAIRAMGEDAVPFLLSVLQALKSADIGKRLAAGVAAGAMFGLPAVLIFSSSDEIVPFQRSMMSLALACLAGLLYGVARIGPGWRTEIAANRLLTQLADKRAVNVLLDVKQSASEWRDSLKSKALVDILLQIRASDAHLLSEKSRQRLLSEIQRTARGEGSFTRNDVSYLLSVISCLEQIGEVRALDSIMRIAEGQYLSSFALPVCKAAREALPSFQQAAAMDRVAGNLLRPTVPPDNDTLVRPSGASETDPQELLVRPVD